MIKKVNILLLIMAAALAGASQRVELDFPKLSGDTAWIYLFTGNRVDSIACPLTPSPPQPPRKGGDAPAQGQNSPPLEGLGVVSIPSGYRGLAYLYIPRGGVGEFILADETVRISSPDERFNAMSLEFSGSEENEFMRRSFQWQSFLLNQKAPPSPPKGGDVSNPRSLALDAHEDALTMAFAEAFATALGGTFLKTTSFPAEGLSEALSKANDAALQHLNDVVAASPLYAARFLELMRFMQRMYTAVQSADSVERQILKNEMEHTLDINALYHAGNLWTDIQSWYPGLFIGADGKPVEADYAASVGTTLRRLAEPVLTAFLSEALVACERANLQQAQEIILTDFITAFPTTTIADPKVQRMIGALGVSKGAPAPTIAGLTTPLTQPAIVIFFDSDCGHCLDEINWLIEHYNELTNNGYRIISIASDLSDTGYSKLAETLPWDKTDRLCDFNGTGGTNFKNYGVVGTPTIFVVGENNILMGKFAQMKEIDNLIK